MTQCLSGVVPRVEYSRSHRRFLHAVKPAFAMTKITEARRMVKAGDTEFFPEETTIITTTTDRDSSLNQLPVVRYPELDRNVYTEEEIVREIGSEFHIPADHSVYPDYSTEKQNEAFEKYASGTMTLNKALQDVSMITLVKGPRKELRERSYALAEEVDSEIVGFYGVRYFTASDSAPKFKEFQRDVQRVGIESDKDIFVIGLLSPNIVSELHENVVAVAGQNQWRKRMTPTKDSDEEMKQVFKELKKDVQTALGWKF